MQKKNTTPIVSLYGTNVKFSKQVKHRGNY